MATMKDNDSRENGKAKIDDMRKKAFVLHIPAPEYFKGSP
jgi:hypothetical protein